MMSDWQVFLTALILGALGLLAIWTFAASRVAASGHAGRELTLAAFALVFVAWLFGAYIRVGLVGAGDAYHYAIQAGDYAVQQRAGVFPVLIGQSEYGFNGNIHTVRTAPLYTHLVGLTDWITGRRLPPSALMNLVVLGMAGLAAMVMTLAIRSYLPAQGFLAGSLGLLYLSAPGVQGLLFARDMVATWMTLPLLPWLVWSACRSVAATDPRRPLVAMAVAHGLLWWAHPPTAAVATIVPGWAVLIRVWRTPHHPTVWTGLALAAVVFVLLIAFPLTSVAELQLQTGQTFGRVNLDLLVQSLTGIWPEVLLPISMLPPASDGEMQLGSALWLLGVMSVGLLLRTRRPELGHRATAGLLLVAIATLAVIALPVPGLTLWVWQLLPDALVGLINPSPHQRSVPILATLVLTLSANTVVPVMVKTWGRSVTLAVLAIILGCTVIDASRLDDRVSKGRLKGAEDALKPHNAILTRYSYILYGYLPPYFNHGYLHPLEEVRWLDHNLTVGRQNIDTSGADTLEAIRVPVEESRRIALPTDRLHILMFDYTFPDTMGSIKVAYGDHVISYGLPASGERLSFGSGPENRRALILPQVPGADPLVDISTSVPGVSVSVKSIERSNLPIRIDSLVPLQVEVDAPSSDGWLETARVFTQGYRATVNGQVAAIRRSPAGFVMVPVPAGPSSVVLDYPGTWALRTTYWLSLGGLVLGGVLLAAASHSSAVSPTTKLSLHKARGLLLAALLGAGTAAYALREVRLAQGQSEDAQKLEQGWVLQVVLPHAPSGPSEPLLCVGEPGKADLLVVDFVAPGKARIRYDHWGLGGPESPVFDYPLGKPILLRVRFPHAGATLQTGQVEVFMNGTRILDQPAARHLTGEHPVHVGQNSVGAGSTGSVFTGEILGENNDRSLFQ